MILTRSLLAGVLSLLLAPAALAYETRFGVDPERDLQALARSGQLELRVSRQDKKVSVDGSAVVRVDIDKFMRVTGNFDQYVAMGVPDIREMKVVDRGAGDLVTTWQNLAASGRESKQYVEFHLQPALPNARARGSEWQMVSQRAPWPYEERSQFKSIEGSWYLEPLADGTVYVRYFQAAEIGSSLPGWLIELVIRNTLENDSKSAFDTFLRVARSS